MFLLRLILGTLFIPLRLGIRSWVLGRKPPWSEIERFLRNRRGGIAFSESPFLSRVIWMYLCEDRLEEAVSAAKIQKALCTEHARIYFAMNHGKGREGYGIPPATIYRKRVTKGMSTAERCIGNLDMAAEQNYIQANMRLQLVEFAERHLSAANPEVRKQKIQLLRKMKNRRGKLDGNVATCLGVKKQHWNQMLHSARVEYASLIESLTQEAASSQEMSAVSLGR